jgi:hypothetical protein
MKLVKRRDTLGESGYSCRREERQRMDLALHTFFLRFESGIQVAEIADHRHKDQEIQRMGKAKLAQKDET